jgi:hypothetical protein
MALFIGIAKKLKKLKKHGAFLHKYPSILALLAFWIKKKSSPPMNNDETLKYQQLGNNFPL